MIASMPTLAVALLLLFAACGQASEHEHLKEEIPPCTPAPGSIVDPCDLDAERVSFSLGHPDLWGVDAPASVREMLDGSPSAWVTHFVLRGTYLPGTVRCTAGDLFRPPAYLQSELGEGLGRFIKCYMDVRANAYIVGSGPPSLTALVLVWGGWEDTPAGETKQFLEYAANAVFPGREHVMFFGPPVDISSEAWRLLGYWDVKRREDGVLVVEHPNIELWQSQRPEDAQTYRDRLVMELPTFVETAAAAHQERTEEYEGRIGADAGLPMLVADANRLRDYYTEVGAYAEGAPTPAPPAPPHPKAEIGEEYPHELFANCTLFDGRFWITDRPIYDGTGNLSPEWENSAAEERAWAIKGVMALAQENAAVFTARNGQAAEFVPIPPEDDACVWP